MVESFLLGSLRTRNSDGLDEDADEVGEIEAVSPGVEGAVVGRGLEVQEGTED